MSSSARQRETPGAPLALGRYELHAEIASGGMATVHVGRLRGAAGISRTVAIKRLHPTFAKDPDFAAMFLDEARTTTRIRHANVVPTIDVVSEGDELFLVMEFVLGESLAGVLRRVRLRGESVPPRVACAIARDVLLGLHAAHETTSESGEELGLVHRDVSPQNVLVGADGVTRVLDFGVAKAAGRTHTTRDGEVKGKLAYMAPEQFLAGDVDRRCDVFAASIVLWEALAGAPLFARDAPGLTIRALLDEKIDPPSARKADIPPELDAVVLRGLERNREQRFATAREMAAAIEAAIDVASPREVSAFLDEAAGDAIRARAALIAAIEAERAPSGVTPPPVVRSAAATTRAADEDPDATKPDARPASAIDPPAIDPSPAGVAPRRRALPIAIAAASLAMVAALAIGLTTRVSGDAPAAASTRAESSATAAGGDAPPPLASATDSSAASSSAASAATVSKPAALETDAAHATAKLATSARAAPKPRPTATSAPTAAPKPDCKNPFRIGADGIRVPRPECF